MTKHIKMITNEQYIKDKHYDVFSVLEQEFELFAKWLKELELKNSNADEIWIRYGETKER